MRGEEAQRSGWDGRNLTLNSFHLTFTQYSCYPPRVPDAARGYLGYVLSHLGDSQILPLMEAAVEARAELAPVMTGNRELLYLDLALEDQVIDMA